MKKLFFICLLIIISSTANAMVVQTDSLRILLTQREQLVKDYQFYNAQNSNFWGKKSKKDLLRIIDTLKGIIRKDTEIINTIKTSTLKKAAAVTLEQTKLTQKVKGEQNEIANTIYTLKTQVANLDNLSKNRQRKISELQEAMDLEREKKISNDVIIAVLALALVGLLIYTVNLRRKLK